MDEASSSHASPSSSRGRHPPHLKGKDIGLFYAKRSAERRNKWKNNEDREWGFKQRFRNKKGRRFKNSDEKDGEPGTSEGTSSKSPEDHPRPVSNWEYRQQKKKREKLALERPLAHVLLSAATKEHIQGLLSNPDVRRFATDVAGSAYEHVEDSVFKQEFLKSITGCLDNRLHPSTLSANSDNPERADMEDDELLLCDQLLRQSEDRKYKQWQERRAKLPAHGKRDELLRLVSEHQVVVVSGETGCGKTTQVPQFLLDNEVLAGRGSRCRVVCTQPRRISAIAVAERVAEERCESLGQSVGYSIRLERKPPRSKGSIIFCTAGVILRQLVNDPSLRGVSHLILDEIHERDITCDFLICIIKKVISIRRDLKVILMSATLNAEAFSKYYNNAPHLNIPGMTFPVEEYYLEDVIEGLRFEFTFKKKPRTMKPDPKFVEYTEELRKSRRYSAHTIRELLNPSAEAMCLPMIHDLLVYICEQKASTGAILVFVTGFMEISDLIGKMKRDGHFPDSRYLIIPLHSMMPTINQREIFLPPPRGKRKIVVATNIAETSITIDDVVYVVDCGLIKMSNYDADTNTQTLGSERVSRANAAQRRGRAGRVQPGICFHLFTRWRRDQLQPFPTPEMLRTRLTNTILSAKRLMVGDIRTFFSGLLDPPADRTVAVSLELLTRMEALDPQERLTPLGYHLARLPMDPQLGKMLVMAALFSCLHPVLSIAVSLDFKDAFLIPIHKEREADKKRHELAEHRTSDHWLLHTALKRYEEARNRQAFCREFFLSPQVLAMLVKLRADFMDHLYDMQYVPSRDSRHPACNQNSGNISLVKAVICAGLYPNVLIARQKGRYITYNQMTDGRKCKPHPKSLLYSLSRDAPSVSPLVVYYHLIKSSAAYAHDLTMVEPLPVILFGDKVQQLTIGKTRVISVGEHLRFKCSESTATLIEELRTRMNEFLQYKVAHPGVVDWRNRTADIMLLEAIKDLITSEDLGDVDLDAYDDMDEEQVEIEDDSVEEVLEDEAKDLGVVDSTTLSDDTDDDDDDD